MKKICLLSILLATLFFVNVYATGNASPAGYWQQISDDSNQPQSIMYLWFDKSNDTLYGKVVTGFLINGKPPETLCKNCPAPFTNKPILGMQILWGFTENGDYWSNGHILDPDKASIYRCTLQLQNENNDLKVHGYIGIPLFGRTQIWHRLTQEQAIAVSKKAYQTLLTTS
jgi:uncharacterized protein (DUF2147 family)